jgi:transcriptional regulator with XRE-family HTH domain
MNDSAKTPYRPLGKHLKDLRTRARESLAETSGAVEIDVRELASYELGKARPNEDVLLLLISHFGAKDDEAVQLWEMAGYTTNKTPASRMTNSDTISAPDRDQKILYSDVVDVMVNNHGVVMNFMQSGPSKDVQVVTRVGMSREHAKSVLRILQITLSQTDNAQPYKIPSTDNKDAQN